MSHGATIRAAAAQMRADIAPKLHHREVRCSPRDLSAIAEVLENLASEFDAKDERIRNLQNALAAAERRNHRIRSAG